MGGGAGDAPRGAVCPGPCARCQPGGGGAPSLCPRRGWVVWEPRQVGHLQAPAPWCPPAPATAPQGPVRVGSCAHSGGRPEGGGGSGVAGRVLVARRAGGRGGRGGREAHAGQAWGVGGRVLSRETFPAHRAAVVLGGDTGGRGQRRSTRGTPKPRPPLTCCSQGTMQPSWKR